MSDIRFTINIYDYENDDRAVLEEWRDDERFDLLTDIANVLFSVEVDSDGESTPKHD